MKKYFKGFCLSLGMFSAIPMPSRLWGESYKSLTLPCLPLIGGLIGTLWWGAALLLSLSRVHTVIAAAILTLLPFFATGFIHLDGYMDTSDAVLSRRPIEEKMRILKDPHVGAFAVIMTAVLFTLQFAAVYVITENEKHFALFVVIAVLSRCCAAVSVLCLNAMHESGYANMFRQNTGAAHKIFVVIVAAIAASLSFIYAGIFGLIVSGAVAFAYTAAMAYAYKDFKGVSGDLAGFAIVISEACGLIMFAVMF